ncbi:RNA polymerase Rpb4-domain-containing protein [Xylariaceae sp. FL0594]|nr:RNA polymerase Rpb4-domain-containing protein [Xylariaceae sp. FL0594]
MRILEAQNAVLTNVEVNTFLTEQAKQYQAEKRRGPANLERIRGETLKYFETFPNPLSQKPPPFDVPAIPVLLEKLQPYKITKGECIMLVNLRPNSTAALNAILEYMTERYSEQQQEEILAIITEVMGEFPAPEEGAEEDMMETSENGA